MGPSGGLVFEWIGLSSSVIWWIAIGSGCMFILAVAVVPWLLIRLPDDYFGHTRRAHAAHKHRCPWFRWIRLIAKNLLGLGFLFFGAMMLVLPGQGILTILIGVALLDFPGKYTLQRWVVTRRGVLDAINWVRQRRGRDPLTLDP